jgi:tRNA uridine 5-carboxymethylaminomethyl modification enzyme
LINDHHWDAFNRKRDAIARETERLKSTYVGAGSQKRASIYELLRRPESTYSKLIPNPAVDAAVADQVEIQAKYEGYISRQRAEVERRKGAEDARLPADLDYSEVRGLSVEVQQKLNRHRPETIGQASRIQGVTPAAVSLLLVHLKRGFGKKKTA